MRNKDLIRAKKQMLHSPSRCCGEEQVQRRRVDLLVSGFRSSLRQGLRAVELLTKELQLFSDFTDQFSTISDAAVQ